MDLAARNASLREQLQDLVAQARLAASGPLLDALRLLSQVHPEPPRPAAQRQTQHTQQLDRQAVWQQERQRLLRELVQLRTQLQVRDDMGGGGSGQMAFWWCNMAWSVHAGHPPRAAAVAPLAAPHRP
jgi:hypothetical protein